MPCRHCKMCRSPLHVDDAHAECVSCLGKSHADSALSGTLFFLPGICAPDWTSGFSQGTIRLSANARPPSLYDELTKLWRTPTRLSSTLQLQLLSHPLTVLKIKDTSTCLLKMNLWLHISARPQLSDGRRRRAIRPSCAEPHLPSLDAPTRWWDKRLQHFTQWLCSRSSRPRCSPVRKPVLDSASLRDLRSMTDLALRATKATAQAIGRSMSSTTSGSRWWRWKRELCPPFSTLRSGSLFGPAVEGFAERFTEAQKSSQALRHFLPKRTSSSSASSRPRPAPTQQTAKPTPTALEPRPPEDREIEGAHTQQDATLSRSSKIVLDPATQKSSQTTWQKEEGSESHYRWTTPQAASIVSLAAHYRKYFSAYHKRPALMQPVCTAVSSPCHSRFIPLPHGPRPGRPSSACQRE